MSRFSSKEAPKGVSVPGEPEGLRGENRITGGRDLLPGFPRFLKPSPPLPLGTPKKDKLNCMQEGVGELRVLL